MTIPLPDLPQAAHDKKYWGNLRSSHASYVLSELAQQSSKTLCIVTATMKAAEQLFDELHFFLSNTNIAIHLFPDWETLPYDHFSPHEDIISDRLAILHQLMLRFKKIVVITTIRSLMNRLAPHQFIVGLRFACKVGDKLDLATYRHALTQAGYHTVNQVATRGEFAIRGSIIDIFPMGADHPYRIDLFDDEIDSIRRFDVASQCSEAEIEQIALLPAHEFPLQQPACEQFIANWQQQFAPNTWQSPLLRSVKQQRSAAGLEYYIPLFFETTTSFIDYLPQNTCIVRVGSIQAESQAAWHDINTRFKFLQYDLDYPALPPQRAFLPPDDIQSQLKALPQIHIQAEKLHKTHAGRVNFDWPDVPGLGKLTDQRQALAQLSHLLSNTASRVLIVAESTGRQQLLIEKLQSMRHTVKRLQHWHDFINSDVPLGICIGQIEHSLYINTAALILISEQDLFTHKVPQRRRRTALQKTQDERVPFKDLAELNEGDAVVHLEHGVARYLGLSTLPVGEQNTEFLTLEYADSDKLYVPISSLHLISRYSAVELNHIPLNRLGTDKWRKAKAKAAKCIHDVAAELLEIQAKRQARSGIAYAQPETLYQQFVEGFPFEETLDQHNAIDSIITDLKRPQPMDRLLCGDVGFGKTEVAMRAAFIAVQNQQQVAILVPTTLLAQQHHQNFTDRFADWPVIIAVLSRFQTAKMQKQTIAHLAEGKIDIVIGTHKLLSRDIKFKNIGLIIIDEEHRFGVRQKERLKALRTEVNLLSMTATPIPRTLNMALSAIRDMSIIATPPAKRLAVNTFIKEYRKDTIKEAVLREVLRGGQVYFLHNNVKTIDHQCVQLQALLPDIEIGIAHGQMSERELEKVMIDFYHNRYHMLLCSTIIETGIDVPNANTIIIDQAHKLGLAQLHQLRGRVGRSHHQAYAYLLTPEWQSLNKDAQKRLQAIEAASELGSGYMIASHDLEIRGAGELLGADQSGNMQTIGFNLYMELLDKTVAAMRQGQHYDIDTLLRPDSQIDIDLSVSTIIPIDYLPDAHIRLGLYKRVSQASNMRMLDEIQIEMIDRFGLLPTSIKHLFACAQLKLMAKALGILKIHAYASGGKIKFAPQPNIASDSIIRLVQAAPKHYQFADATTLKFQQDLADTTKRVAFVENLLKKLKT